MLHSQFYLVDAEITLWTYEDGDIDGNVVYNFHCYEPIIFTHQLL